MDTLTKLKKKVIIYARKSRLKNDDDMEISRQVELCTSYAILNNLEYEVVSEEGSSESWEGRRELQRMIKMLKSSMYDGVLVTDQDRIARDAVDFGLFKRLCREEGLTLYTLNKTYNLLNDDDNFITGIQAEMDNQFMRITKRKLMRGRKQALEQGIYFGIPPYGYNKSQTKPKKLIPDPVESKVVQTIFDMLVNKGKNAMEIAETINLMGMKSREGKDFTNKLIYYITSNVAYTGKLEYQLKGQDLISVEDAHEAIISKDMFEAAQALRRERKIVPQDIRRGSYLLSKLIKCGNCGTTLSFCYKYVNRLGKETLDKSLRELFVISCWASLSSVRKQQLGKENRCDCIGIKASRIEGAVLEDLRSHLYSLDDEIESLMESGNEFFNEINEKVEMYNKRLKSLDGERKKVQEGWQLGIYEPDEAKEMMRNIKENRLLIEKKKSEIESIDVSVEINRKNIMKEKILDLLSGNIEDAVAANRILREVIDSIYYYKEVSDTSHKKYPFELAIKYKE